MLLHQQRRAGRGAALWTLLACVLLSSHASAREGSVVLPERASTVGLMASRWQGASGWGDGLALRLDSGVRDGAAGLTFGLDAGAVTAGLGSGKGGDDPGADKPSLLLAGRVGGVWGLHGWNLLWPGELLLVSEAELRYDVEHPWLRGWRLLPRIGLRVIVGHGSWLVGRLDADVAPSVYGDRRSGGPSPIWVARLRASVGLQRLQLVAAYERWGVRSEVGSLSRFTVGLQFGFGGGR
ncbi:MAG: hypothetical protein H6747_06655 [Deltaproteobacteria bacterium]|nr:hypothetical protein [Deltaproteobacteria bacterium]